MPIREAMELVHTPFLGELRGTLMDLAANF